MKLPSVSPAMSVSVVALVVALGGTSYAAASINGNDIKAKSINSSKIKKDSLGSGVIKDGNLYVQAAAGIVADSVPEMEWLETENKARAVLRAAEQVQDGLDGEI